MRPADLAAEIEWAKARLVTPDGVPAEARRAGRDRPPSPLDRIAELYDRYEDEKRTRRLVDFDDLLAAVRRRDRAATRRSPPPSAGGSGTCSSTSSRTSTRCRTGCLRAWLGDRDDLCVVGDPNQAIYRWNGADASFLADFGRHHPGAEVVELDRQLPVDAGDPRRGRVGAAPATGAARARCVRTGRDGPLPTVLGFDTDAGEASGIARAAPRRARAARARGRRRRCSCAPTPRPRSSRRRCARSRIPYRVRGGQALLDEPDVRDLLRGLARSNEPFVTTLADLA